MDRQLDKIPTILDRFLTCIANTTNTQLAIKWYRVGRHKVVGKSYVKTKIQIAAVIAILSPYTYHTKQLNPQIMSPDNHMVIYSWLSTYPGETVEPFRKHLKHSQASPYQHATANTTQETLNTDTHLNCQLMSDYYEFLLLCNGDKCVLLIQLCVEAGFVKSSDIAIAMQLYEL